MLHAEISRELRRGSHVCLATHLPCIAIMRRTRALLRLLRRSWLMAIMSEKRLRIRWSISSSRDTSQPSNSSHQLQLVTRWDFTRDTLNATVIVGQLRNISNIFVDYPDQYNEVGVQNELLFYALFWTRQNHHEAHEGRSRWVPQLHFETEH